MFDNSCKRLAEKYPSDFSNWLLGKPISLTKIEPSELSTEAIRADSVTFMESTEVVLHVEFQTTTHPEMAFRMLDYGARLYKRYHNKKIHQTVIYLKRTNSP
jgi:predicted transposase/invertase (TIGR01784 family)